MSSLDESVFAVGTSKDRKFRISCVVEQYDSNTIACLTVVKLAAVGDPTEAMRVYAVYVYTEKKLIKDLRENVLSSQGWYLLPMWGALNSIPEELHFDSW